MSLFNSLKRKKKTQKENNLLGYAIIKKDNLTGKKMWVSYNGEGKDEVTFSAGQPLTFPPEELQVGTKIELFAPEK